jgi:hypothetical protein
MILSDDNELLIKTINRMIMSVLNEGKWKIMDDNE